MGLESSALYPYFVIIIFTMKYDWNSTFYIKRAADPDQKQ